MTRPAPRQSHRRALLQCWQQCEVDSVLAMAVDSLGSSYRKPGAMALFDAQGGLSGSLSGGCLDAEIAEHARICLQQRRPQR
ncbi:MAG: XdhC family protein, partial [Xanthomonadales bacterium]|nr:XdhC family protein [Xanthomonadales bacterium]